MYKNVERVCRVNVCEHGIKHSPFFRTSIYILNRALFQAIPSYGGSLLFARIPRTTLLRKAFTKIQIQRRVRDSIMAKASLDVVTLVRLDSKSTPRVRSFRERAEVCLLCVCDACADRCAFVSALSRARQLCCRDPLGSQKHVGMHAPTAFRMRLDASNKRGKDGLCARLMRARA